MHGVPARGGCQEPPQASAGWAAAGGTTAGMLSPGSSGTGGWDGWVTASVPPSLVPAPPPNRGGRRVSTSLCAGLDPSWHAGRMPVPQLGPTWHGMGECKWKARARWQPCCPKPNLMHPHAYTQPPPKQCSPRVTPPKPRVTSLMGTSRAPQRPPVPRSLQGTSPASPGHVTGITRAGAAPPHMRRALTKTMALLETRDRKH